MLRTGVGAQDEAFRAASPVPVQMWQGWARSRSGCGRGEPSPGAAVAGAWTPSPVRMWSAPLVVAPIAQQDRLHVSRLAQARLALRSEPLTATPGEGPRSTQTRTFRAPPPPLHTDLRPAPSQEDALSIALPTALCVSTPSPYCTAGGRMGAPRPCGACTAPPAPGTSAALPAQGSHRAAVHAGPPHDRRRAALPHLHRDWARPTIGAGPPCAGGCAVAPLRDIAALLRCSWRQCAAAERPASADRCTPPALARSTLLQFASRTRAPIASDAPRPRRPRPRQRARDAAAAGEGRLAWHCMARAPPPRAKVNVCWNLLAGLRAHLAVPVQM